MEVILIRHGEPTYDEVAKWGDIGLGFELGKLTDLGVKQAEEVSKNSLLKGATLIVSSPYTRSLQTAAIISKNTGLDLSIETELHEWFWDTTFKFEGEVSESYNRYIKSKGIKSKDEKYNFEEYEVIKERVFNSLKPYQHHKKIIVVSHGIVMSAFTDFEDLIEHCGIRVVNID